MVNKVFNTSVNIKFDWQNPKLINDYIPTPSHAEFLRNVTSSLLGMNNQSAHLLIGPYGSGKSLIALIVSSIMSGNIKSTHYSKLAEKFSDVDQDIYTKLLELEQYDKNYIPIILSGAENSFKGVIIQTIINTLEELGIHLNLKTDYHRILVIIDEWQQFYKATFNQFKVKLKERNLNIRTWKKKLANETRKEVQWFAEIYPKLTSGAGLVLNYNLNLTETLDEILLELEQQNKKLLIVFDEFGRFIQTLENREFIQTMGDLQDLSEFVTRNSDKMQLLLIAHKNLSQYANLSYDDLKNDFERIEKRLRKYYVESDKSTFYRIAAQYVKKINAPQIKNNIEDLAILKKYNLFDDLNSVEVEKIIFKGISPIHPITLLLLPKLSNLFGQNERTLFTFLESNELGGLQDHISRTNTYYLPVALFDYFFSDTTNMLKEDSFHELKIYYQNRSKLVAAESSMEVEVLKIITLWYLTDLNKKVNLNAELMSYSLQTSLEQIEKVLADLIYKKVIYKNRRTNQWELAESSIAEIEKLIQNERTNVKIDSNSRLKLLNRLLPNKYYFANRYNSEYDITRFAVINFILPENLSSLTFKGNADFYIYLVLTDSEEELSVNESIEKLNNTNCLFTLINKEKLPIMKWLDEYALINSLLMQKSILYEYKNLEKELLLTQQELLYQLENFYNPIIQLKKEITWFNRSMKITFKSVTEIEEYLSEFMFNNYRYTPVIHNDAINRFKVNSLQYKALQSVVDGIIQKPNHVTLGIEGKGPDYLIYATVLKNNHLNIGYLNEMQNESYVLLRNYIIQQLVNNSEGNLQSIVEIFKGENFGIRDPLIPLLFVALTRDIWDQILFLNKGAHIKAIDGKKLYAMFENPREYEYHYIEFETDFKQFLREIEQSFKEFESTNVSNESILIKSSSSLLAALRSLPKYTQMTNNLDEDLLEFKVLVRKLEINPSENFGLIFNKFKAASNIVNLFNKLKLVFNNLESSLLDILLNSLSIKDTESIGEFVSSFDENQINKSKILKMLAENEVFDLKKFMKNYIGISIEDWTDSTYELYQNQLVLDIQKIYEDDQNNAQYLKMMDQVGLSTKATSIYNNVNQIIKNAGRNLPREEIELILQKLLHEYSC